MENLKEWFSSMEEDLKTNNKKFVIIGGASCSGKSVSTGFFKSYLENHGKKVLYIEADKYYKSMSTVLTDKALQNPQFKKYLPIRDIIAEKVKQSTEPYTIEEKFSQTNIYNLYNALSPLIDNADIMPFINELKDYCKHYNFDEPFVVDLDLLANHINTLNNGGTIYLPKYSMKTSETSISNEHFSGFDYDYILIEGLYALRDEVLTKIDRNNVVTSCIQCPPKTMFARRLHRDIKTARVGSSPERTIISALKDVLPSYYKDIEPTFKQADHVLNTSLTDTEINNREKSRQSKFTYNLEDARKWERLNLLELSKPRYQTDHYFKDNNNSKLTLRLRIEDGKASELSFKIGDDTTERRVENYDLTKIFSEENRDPEYLMKLFRIGGFERLFTVYKLRRYGKLKNYNKDIDIRLDTTNFGFVLEISNATPAEEEYIAELLHLKRIDKNISYETMYHEHIKHYPNYSTMVDNIFKKNLGDYNA